MRSTLTLCVLAALTFSGTLFGQAIIGYGVNVGRAGAAGAASGAGAAGIFTGVKGALDQPDPKKGAEAPRQATVDAGVDEKKEEDKDKSAKVQESELEGQTKSEAPASWDSGTLTTPTGFVISGLQRRPTRSGYGPSSSGPVVKVAGSEPSAVAAASTPSSSEAAVSERTSQQATGTSQPTSPASSGVFEPIVTQFGSARGEPRQVESETAVQDRQSVDAARIEIPLGTPVKDLVKRFGDPLLVLTGISGEEYTEKYVFRTPDGARFTVLSVEGKVTAVLAEPDGNATTAAL